MMIAAKKAMMMLSTHLMKLALIMWVLLSQTLAVELDLTVWKSLLKKHQRRKKKITQAQMAY